MKFLFSVAIIIHGLIHLMGFFRGSELAKVNEFSAAPVSPEKNISLIAVLSLIGCLLFMISAIGYYIGKSWWWIPCLLAIILSQTLIVLYWKEAKWGTLANLVILAGVIVGFGQWKFKVMVKSEVNQLYAPITIQDNTVVTKEMLNGLPEPVQNWLSNSGIIGKKRIQTLRLKQKGSMRSEPKETTWSLMHAEQYITIDEPSFIWKAHIQIKPAISIQARDKYVNGKGEMKIKILSLIPIANSTGYQVDQGTLQRWLAEICWFPCAALSPFIKWEPIDDSSAQATLAYKGVSGSATFYFNEQGDITACTADRFMSSGKNISLEKWEVKSTEYGIMDGIRIPVKSEATWKLTTGDFTWLKLEITNIEYNKIALY